MTAHQRRTDGAPLVVHVIPSPRGRGAQRAARILVDSLDRPGLEDHRLLGLFTGPPEVVLDLSLDHPSGRRGATGFRPSVAFGLRRVLRCVHPAAVVAHGGDAMKYVIPAVVGTRIPVAYCVIGTYAGAPGWPHVWRWKQIMARADLVVAVGQEVLEECTDRFGVPASRTVMIPNGRDPSLFYPRSERAQGETTLVFVGALTAQKQPDRFVEVVRSLRVRGRTVRGVIVGDGPLADALAGPSAALGIDLLGPRPDVPELLRDSDLFVFTSRPAGEGMPGVLIEAGLSGLPAVSTRVPGATSVIRDGITGSIVDDSVTGLVGAIEEILQDPGRQVAMGAAARAWCEAEFSLDLMAQRWRARAGAVAVWSGWRHARGLTAPGRTRARSKSSPASRRPLTPCELPLVAGRRPARPSGDTQDDHEEGEHHGRLSRDQSQVAQRSEEVAEEGREDRAHHQVGTGE